MSTRNIRRAAKKHAAKNPPNMANGPVQIQISVQGNAVAMIFDRPVTRIDFTGDEAMGVIQGLHNNVSILAARVREAQAATPANETNPPEPPKEVMSNTEDPAMG